MGGGGGAGFLERGGGGGGAFLFSGVPFRVVELDFLETAPPYEDTGDGFRPIYVLSGLVPLIGLGSSDCSMYGSTYDLPMVRDCTLFLRPI